MALLPRWSQPRFFSWVPWHFFGSGLIFFVEMALLSNRFINLSHSIIKMGDWYIYICDLWFTIIIIICWLMLEFMVFNQLMSTPDFAKPWFMTFMTIRGYSSNSHFIKYLNGTLPIKQPRGLLIQGWHYVYIYIYMYYISIRFITIID